MPEFLSSLTNVAKSWRYNRERGGSRLWIAAHFSLVEVTVQRVSTLHKNIIIRDKCWLTAALPWDTHCRWPQCHHLPCMIYQGGSDTTLMEMWRSVSVPSKCNIPFGCQLLLLLLLTLSSWSLSSLLLSDASLSRVARGSLKLVQILDFTIIQKQQEYTVMPGFRIYLLNPDPKM